MGRLLSLSGDEDSPRGDLWRYELALRESGYEVVAGVDEAGRGALAGPVVAAAVVLDAALPIPGINDSKALDADHRLRLFRRIRALARAVGVGIVQADTVDERNVLRATQKAMARAIARLHPPPDFALIDGNPIEGIDVRHECIVKGDSRNYLIAAASIVAKVTRDRIMVDLAAQYPGYGFEGHKGYGTAAHRRVIARLGPCPAHRRTFAPVARVLEPTLPGLD